MKNEIRGFSIGDIHLGNTRTTAKFIVDNLKRYIITNHNRLQEVDYIFMLGDLVDRLLSLGSSESNEVIGFSIWLAMYCKRHGIKLRFLKGTPSHDFDQLSTFTSIFEDNAIEVDYKYFDKISIEYDVDNEIHILYIPDEASESPEATLLTVKSIMEEMNITEVDIACMHGMFSYQLPFNLSEAFTEKDFDFVKYYILIAHIHIHNPKGKIIPPGSFDRLSFGEEGPKGAVFFKLSPHGAKEFTFIENVRAKLYPTIDIKTYDIVIARDIINKFLEDYKGDMLRLKVYDNELDTGILISEFRGRLNITIHKEDNEQADEIITDEIIESRQFSITRENIEALLIEEVGEDEIMLEELRRIL